MLTERGPRDRLWHVASRQRGYFTAAQALQAGYSYRPQQFHKKRGNWTQIDRGIYRFREYLDLPSQDTDPFVRWSLWSRGRAVVSHTSALAVHDLGIANPAEIHLTVPSHFRQKSSAVVLHRCELAETDVEQHEGFRVTTPLRAAAETAASGADQDVIDSASQSFSAEVWPAAGVSYTRRSSWVHRLSWPWNVLSERRGNDAVRGGDRCAACWKSAQAGVRQVGPPRLRQPDADPFPVATPDPQPRVARGYPELGEELTETASDFPSAQKLLRGFWSTTHDVSGTEH